MTDIPTPPTPGPWRVLSTESLASVSVYSSTTSYSIAAVWAKRGRFHPTRASWEEARANARLISAAPDLWEALSEVLEDGYVMRSMKPAVLAKARAALDKADGGTAP